jgi:hypothetical protein
LEETGDYEFALSSFDDLSKFDRNASTRCSEPPSAVAGVWDR